jgi:hypothetical protein
MTRHLWRTLALLLSVTPALALAQGTSAITGVVSDAASGKPVADVVVTATSPALQGDRTVVTDAAGLYRLSQLPPGTYTLRLEKESFKPFSRGDVQVRVDRTIRVNVQLQPESMQSEEILVVGRAPTVDVGSAQQGLSLTKDFVDRVALITPNATGQRSFEALARAAPQVTSDEYGFGFNGGQSPENLYVVDGVQVNDPTYGSLTTNIGVGGAQLPVEFVEEANIITGGYMPEWGRAGGGVLNVVTKSGSNTLKGSVWGNWWPGGLTATARTVRNEGSAIERDSQRHNTGDFGAEVGGAIVKDRLWFYAGVAQSVDRRRVTRGIRRFLLTEDRSDFLYDDTGSIRTERIAESSRFDDRRSFTWLAKLTFLVNSNNTLALSVTGSPQQRVDPVFQPLGYGGELTATNSTTASLKYTGSFLDKQLLVDATAGWSRTDQSLLPNDGSRPGDTTGFAGVPATTFRRNPPLSIREFETLPDEVADLCEPAGFVASRRVPYRGLNRFVMACPVTGGGATYSLGGPGFMQESQADRLQARANVSYLFQALGHHIARAGVDLEWTQYRVTKAYSGGVALIDFPAVVGADLLGQRDEAYLAGPNERVPLLAFRSSPSQFTTGLYVQDSWSVLDAVTINGGLRYDTQQLFASNGQLGLSLNNMLSPRVGVIYDFTQQGRSKLFANYAVYHQNIPLQMADRALSGEWATYTYNSAAGCDPIGNPQGARLACSDPANAVPLNEDPYAPSPNYVRFASGRTMVDPNLKPTAKGEITAGLEYELFANVRAGLIGTHNWLFNVVEDMSNDEAATYFIGNPGSGLAKQFPRAERRYFAGTLYVSRAFSDGWLLQSSYTLSSLYGNYSGLFRPETGQLDPGITSDFDLKSLLANRTGFLPGDRTHQVKAYVAKDFELSSSVSLLAGLSYEGFSGRPINYLARHPLYGNDETFVFPRGSGGRTPWTHTVSARAGLTVKVSKEQAVQVSLDVFNLFNLQEAVDVSERFSTIEILPANVPAGTDPQRAACLAGNDPTCVSVLQKKVGPTVSPVQSTDLNGNFKQPTLYQLPLSVRLGVKLTF